MNRREKLALQRDLIAWGDWNRQGRTWPNRLGYKPSTVEYALMHGDTGGKCPSGCVTPSRFNDDHKVRVIDRVFWKMPEKLQETVSGVYAYRFTKTRLALILGITPKQVTRRLNQAYPLFLIELSKPQITCNFNAYEVYISLPLTGKLPLKGFQ